MKNDDAFADATERAGSANYLGDIARVKRFLQTKGSEFLKAVDGGTDPADAARPVAQSIAQVLLGEDPAWTAVPGWNEPGAIDFALARAMDVADGSPDEVMEHWALSFLISLLNVAKYAAEDGVTPEQWQWQAEDLYETFTKNALGIPVPPDDDE